jgi:hypothetical protein
MLNHVIRRSSLHSCILRTLITSSAVAALAGCSGDSPSTTPPVVTSTIPSVYVLQVPSNSAASGSILQFSSTANGVVSPTSTITVSGATFNGLAADGSGNLYSDEVSGGNSFGQVVEFAAGATGAATPIRSIPGNTVTGVTAVDGISAGPTGEIFVGEDYGAAQVFSATANGSVAPTRNILGISQPGGGLSTLGVATAIAADSSDNLFVVNAGNPGSAPIAIFSPTATGNVAPIRTIGGALTTLGQVTGLTVDATGNLYVGSVTSTFSNNVLTYVGSIVVFGPTASGNVAPMRTITGPLTTMAVIGGPRLDASGNIYVVSSNGSASSATKTTTVLKFAAAAAGNVAPTSSFTSAAWTNPDYAYSIAIH